jgi:triacylglycerol esterase/lipase EstA (alpha/beta hydrolase family)
VNFGINHPAEDLGLVAGAETPRAVLYQASGNALPVDWKWSDTNKVNFICHSQGGTTVRCLIELLSGASDRNLTAFLGVDRQPWVNSVVTIGTPHKGTTVTDVVNVSLSVQRSIDGRQRLSSQ